MFIDVGKLGKTATFLSCAFKRCVHVTAYLCGKKPKQQLTIAASSLSMMPKGSVLLLESYITT